MGRSKSKPVPKRPRLEDNDNDEAKAIAMLQSVPQEQVEEAAAEATRADLDQNWPHLVNVKENYEIATHPATEGTSHPPSNDDTKNVRPLQSYQHITSSVPPWAHGLGSSCKIDPQHFVALQTLHSAIKSQSPQWTSWSGNPSDPRQRAFGFLPGTLGYDERVRQQLDISMPWRDVSKDDNDDPKEGEEEERSRNERAIVVLEKQPDGVEAAIEHVCDLFRECFVQSEKEKESDTNHNDHDKSVPQKPNHFLLLKDFLQYRNLIAAQPNLHNGRALLPVHLDHPCKDGFGVVIITVAMTGKARILLHDVTGTKGLAMPLQQGEAYMLSAMARDACVHGVLADVGSEQRESLNLRFGLHDLELPPAMDDETKDQQTNDETPPLPVVPSSQVLKYW
ncbi:hypothetical protein IV203_015372 [Nitzschia inconspicua]|uniref:Uncharacterized protein n=1 Tax=Nitzschia inconspicua TaxID=303405 RepID=A0A9K3PTE6_9STRA|nr:hypothetical protein IV203_015372 [Nitzschia inconspicua]